jgi:very-short-patch-repair endonuclease
MPLRPNRTIMRDALDAVSELLALASPSGPRGTVDVEIRQAIDWQQLPERMQADLMSEIEAGVGHFDADRLFWLLWAAARLDINLFEGADVFGPALLDNLDRLESEDILKAQHFPKAIWALTIFLRKYAGDDASLEAALIEKIGRRLEILSDKIDDLQVRPNDISQLIQVKQLLKPYQARLAWPCELDDVLSENKLPSEDSQSALERAVFRKLKQLRLGVQFEPSYYDEATNHIIDIAIPEHKVAIEVDGPGHFYAERRRGPRDEICFESTDRIDTKSWARNLLLQEAGWTVISIPFQAWNALQASVEKTATASSSRYQRVGRQPNHYGKYLREKLQPHLPADSASAAASGKAQAKKSGPHASAASASYFNALLQLSDNDAASSSTSSDEDVQPEIKSAPQRSQPKPASAKARRRRNKRRAHRGASASSESPTSGHSGSDTTERGEQSVLKKFNAALFFATVVTTGLLMAMMNTGESAEQARPSL